MTHTKNRWIHFEKEGCGFVIENQLILSFRILLSFQVLEAIHLLRQAFLLQEMQKLVVLKFHQIKDDDSNKPNTDKPHLEKQIP